jgi:mannitol-specific phosphotransferase system IIBC component
MAYIRKLPLLLATSGAVITGLAGYAYGVDNKENMTNMVIAMIVFYIVGLLIRNTVNDIAETIRKKAEERELEEKKRLAEEKKKEEEEEAKKAEAAKNNESILNLVADEKIDLGFDDDEFNELPIADYIKNELRK